MLAERLTIALLLTASIVIPPMFLWWVTQRSRLAPFFRGTTGIANTFMGTMSVLFVLNLVFICSDVWKTRESAKLAMSRETDALGNIASIAANIPQRGGVPLIEAAREYAEAAIAFDFPRDGLPAEGAAPSSLTRSSLPAMDHLTSVVLDNVLLQKLDPSMRPLLLAQLTGVRDKRLERIALTEINPSKVKWLSLVSLLIVALCAITLNHIANGRALLIVSFVYLLAINPFVATLYYCQSPFSGFDALTASQLEETLVKLQNKEATCRNTEFADSRC